MSEKNNVTRLGNQAKHQLLIQQRFGEMKDILIKTNECSTTFNLITSETYKAMYTIAGELHCSITHDTPAYTEISLSVKSQYGEENDLDFSLGRASIMVSPIFPVSEHLYSSAEEIVNATLFARANDSDSDVSDDEGGDKCPPSMDGCLSFAGKHNSYVLGLEEISALVEIAENKEYIFIFYIEDDVLFIKRLTSLEDVDLFAAKDE